MKTYSLESNKLIAEFMGGRFSPSFNKWVRLKDTEGRLITSDRLGYHSSWDWLMPVVHKCLAICHEKMLNEWEDSFSVIFSACNIEMMYNESVEFIKWYNETSK